jgi:poly(3-hydroxybutyrate) depolymerase
MLPLFENSFLYTCVEMMRAGLMPFRSVVKVMEDSLNHPSNVWVRNSFGRSIYALVEVSERLTRSYPKPDWGIFDTVVNGEVVRVEKETVVNKPFCNLIHFKKQESTNQPVLLIVAPLSGHHATLLRGTVQALLPYYDVYTTDWVSACQVPVSYGKFDLDDYIDYVIEFFEYLGYGFHVLAVCQPVVPVAAAIAIMEESGSSLPAAAVLIGGPIDVRCRPTEVDKFAKTRTVDWLENHVITRVPANYPGFTRSVYPGFVQLAGFMSMNMKRHVGEHVKLFEHLLVGDGDSVDTHTKFYDEYLAVLDLTAEFYLQTIKTVFHDYSLPRGVMVSKGRPVSLAYIKKTPILAIEGELDDISGIGQTKAAIELCFNLPENKKHYHLQNGVGHYGLFNGSKFRNHIVPVIREFLSGFEKAS